MHKGKKTLITAINLFVFASILASAAISAAVFNVVEAAIQLSAAPKFTATDSHGHTYKCYTVADRADCVSIAWGEGYDDTPETLEIDETVTADAEKYPNYEGTYTVIGIAKAGFARCDFKDIVLPQTIEEIGEGAFAYCHDLEIFTFPWQITKIESSTFLDCRKLRNVRHTNAIRNAESEEHEIIRYSVSNTNEMITRIENHAFDSCVSLLQFDCPESLVYFGKSSFQKCTSLTRFYFPSLTIDKTTKQQKYGNVEVDSYAFADCSKLSWIYFEKNMGMIRDYAFVDCVITDYNPDKAMQIHYAWSDKSRPSFTFENNWKRMSLKTGQTAEYKEENSHNLTYAVDGYPGLRYGIESADVYANCMNNGTKNNYTKVITGGANNKYAVVYQWNNPGYTPENEYYNHLTKKLILPDSLVDKETGNSCTLKVIAEEAFRDRDDDLRIVKFNEGLVQIRKRAFYNCIHIQELDFDKITTLLEISNCIFSDSNTKDNKMCEEMTTLKLPASLKFLGRYAFYNFVWVDNLSFQTDDDIANSRHPSLQAIGGYAFGRIGMAWNTGKFSVTLPCTLDDEIAKLLKTNSKENNDYNEQNWAAIGPYVFGGANGENTAVKEIIMEECNCADHTHASNRISIAPNAFARAKYLTRFMSSSNLCLIGADAFKDCINLKEVFIKTAGAKAYADANPTKQVVYGTKDEGATFDQSLFSGTLLPDLIIYLDGEAPGAIDNLQTISHDQVRWNSESFTSYSYATDLGYTTSGNNASDDKHRHTQSRSSVPTLYKMDWDGEGNLLYYHPKDGTFRDTAPTTNEDYFEGNIIFAKAQGSSKYTLVKYFCQNGGSPATTTRTEEIDLTNIKYTKNDNTVIDISANLTTIGPEAFASNNTTKTANAQDPCPGKFFILPSSVKEIGERAFYRRAGDNASAVDWYGAVIVTFTRDATYTAAKNLWNTGDEDKYGYAKLDGIETIGKDAFYNNNFKTVSLSSSLIYLGKSAFYTHYSNGIRSSLETVSFSDSTSTIFDVENDGIYYIGDANKKTLLYQAQKEIVTAEGVTTTQDELTIASGTKAIGMGAVANTSYVTINLNSELTNIYGSAFQKNSALTTVNGGSGVKYIGAMASGSLIGGATATYIGKRTDLGEAVSGTIAQTIGIVKKDAASSNSAGAVQKYVTKIVNGSSSQDTNTKMWPYLTSKYNTIYCTDAKINDNSLFYSIVDDVNDEIWDDTLPFDVDDHRYALNGIRDKIESRSSAFQDCNALTTINLKAMTGLIKIGHGAFRNDSSLSNLTGGGTYTFYNFQVSGNTASLKPNPVEITDGAGVLDLSDCTNLKVIGKDAFGGCSSINYAILPDTGGNLYVAHDPDAPWITKSSIPDELSGTVFNGGTNSGTKVLLRDLVNEACTWVYTTDTSHYGNNWHKRTNQYFHLEGIGTITDKNSDIKYWVEYGENGYILFENAAQAKAYYEIFLPSINNNNG